MDQSWNKLPMQLVPAIENTIKDFGFNKMTPVQTACIPLLLKHKDVAAEAVTGSGKTLAFVVPIIQILCKLENPMKKHDVGALIISPTRELATQIHEVIEGFLKHAPHITSLLSVGGSFIGDDLHKFSTNGGHIIVGTPGRLEDLLSRTSSNSSPLAAGVKALEVLILDEADRLLDMGFFNTLNTIFAYLPKQRRTGLFSATQTSDVISLIRAGLRNPVQVKVKENNAVGEERTPQSLENYYMVCKEEEKFNTLMHLLLEKKDKKTMIFFSTCACVEHFTGMLKKFLKNDQIFSLHGKMKERRFKIFDNFRNAKSGVLVCTDVMCRGVDIPSIDWVIQFDPPSSAASFVHRCGRTARSGQAGSALLLLLPYETEYVDFLQLNQKVTLQEMEAPACSNYLDQMRKLQLDDRLHMDKANRAFVSFIQSYGKHECSIILSLKKVNFGKLATCYGLLKMPRMPELKGIKITDFTYVRMDYNTISYKDKQKEKSRQQKLNTYKETGEWPGMKMHVPRKEAWSEQKDRKEKKRRRKEKKVKKKSHKFSQEDLDDLEEDFKMVKKLKKGKVKKEDFDKYFGCELDEADGETPTKATK